MCFIAMFTKISMGHNSVYLCYEDKKLKRRIRIVCELIAVFFFFFEKEYNPFFYISLCDF